ncbi:MAG: hypothetical protein ACNYVW_00465 [Methanosarcinales archaeon]
MSFLKRYRDCRKLHTASFCLRDSIGETAKPVPQSLPALLHRATGCPQDHIYIRDAQLDTIAYEEAQDFLKYDKTDQKHYVRNTFDCDDFADLLYVAARMYFLEKGINAAWGNVWDSGHATNCFISNLHKVYIVEPQTDELHSIEYLQGRPRFIKM